MTDLFTASAFLGLLLSLGFFLLGRAINRRAGRLVVNPLLLATVLCILTLTLLRVDYETYYLSARYLDVLITPTTICLAIPLYRQYELLKKNAAAVLAGVASGVVGHMAACVALLLIFRMERSGFLSLLPKSITTAIGSPLSAELGGMPEVTVALIMLSGLTGAVTAPAVMKLFRVTEPLAQGLGIGTASHAIGTSRAVELGDLQGAASGLAIVVTGLMTTFAAPLVANLIG